MSFKYLRIIWLPGPRSGLQPVTLAPKMSDQALCHHNHTATRGVSPAHMRGKGEGRLLTKRSPGLLTAPTSDNPIPRLQLITACSTKKPPKLSSIQQRGLPTIPAHPCGNRHESRCALQTLPALARGSTEAAPPTPMPLSLLKEPVFPMGTKRQQRPSDTCR